MSHAILMRGVRSTLLLIAVALPAGAAAEPEPSPPYSATFRSVSAQDLAQSVGVPCAHAQAHALAARVQ